MMAGKLLRPVAIVDERVRLSFDRVGLLRKKNKNSSREQHFVPELLDSCEIGLLQQG